METDKLGEAFKSLPEMPLPDKLNKKTIKNILVYKLKPGIYIITALLIANFCFLTNNFYHYLLESEALTVIQAGLQSFEISFDYFFNSLLGLKEILPLASSISLAVNLFLIIYAVTVFKRYRHELL